MGSSPTQPQPPQPLQPPLQTNQALLKSNLSQVSVKKSIKPKVVKQEVIEEPKNQLIAKVAPKETAMRLYIDPGRQNTIDQAKEQIKGEFKLRFVVKCYKREIRAVFGEKESKEESQLHVFSQVQVKSEEKLQKLYWKDLKIYQQIFQIRLKSIVSDIFAKENNISQQNQQKFSRTMQQILVRFRQCMATLLGQIQGKTSVWHSLSLTQPQITVNIISFCHQEGVDSSKFDFLAQS